MGSPNLKLRDHGPSSFAQAKLSLAQLLRKVLVSFLKAMHGLMFVHFKTKAEEVLCDVAKIVFIWICIASFLNAARPKSCLTLEDAAKLANKDVCVDAHVYNVVELADGSRFLDVCRPETPDEECRFTIVSPREDREDVGELRKFRDADVHVRGIVQRMHGRSGMVLSHARQFYGGPPKFKPNPKLLHGFSGEQAKPPIADPSLRPHGGHRAFMNSRDQETLHAR